MKKRFKGFLAVLMLLALLVTVLSPLIAGAATTADIRMRTYNGGNLGSYEKITTINTPGNYTLPTTLPSQFNVPSGYQLECYFYEQHNRNYRPGSVVGATTGNTNITGFFIPVSASERVKVSISPSFKEVAPGETVTFTITGDSNIGTYYHAGATMSIGSFSKSDPTGSDLNGPFDFKYIDKKDGDGNSIAPAGTKTATSISWKPTDPNISGYSAAQRLMQPEKQPFTFTVTVPEDAVNGSTYTVPVSFEHIIRYYSTLNAFTNTSYKGTAQAVLTVRAEETAEPVLEIEKTVDKAAANPGDTLNYSITVSNTGDAPATNVEVTDLLSLNSTAVPGGVTLACTDDSVNIDGTNATIPVLAAGESAQLTGSFIVPADGTVKNGDVYLNEASAVCTEDPEPVEDDAETVIEAAPELQIEKTVDKAKANPGDTLNYTITVRNTGSAAATDVEIGDVLKKNGDTIPNGVTLTCTDETVVTNGSVAVVPSLAPGASIVLTGSYVIPTNGSVQNGDVYLNEANANCKEDPDMVEDDAETIVEAAPVLEIEKTVDKSKANPGDTLNYTITVRNSGNAAATDVTIRDLLKKHGVAVPGGITLTSEDASVEINGMTASVASLAPGASVVLTGSYVVPADGSVKNGDLYVNEANANCTENPELVEDDAETVIEAAPALEIEKTVNQAKAKPGETLRYRITVRNTGNAPAVNVVINDLMQLNGSAFAHPELASATPGVVIDGNKATLQSLAVGASIVLEYEVMAPNTAGILLNTATVVDEDGNTGTDTAEVTIESETTTSTTTTTETSTTEPGSSSTEPGSSSTEPGSSSTEPGSSSTEPGSSSTEPGTSGPSTSKTSTTAGTSEETPASGGKNPFTGTNSSTVWIALLAVAGCGMILSLFVRKRTTV